jgi:hypothetical protein
MCRAAAMKHTEIDTGEKPQGPRGDPNRRTRPGQAAVEFALAGTVLIALLFGVLEVGRLMFINSEVQNAAREGAQIASMNPFIDCGNATNTTLTAQVRARMVVTNRSTVSVVGPCFMDSGGVWQCSHQMPWSRPEGFDPFYKVKVSVTAQWTSVVSFIPPVTLQSSSVKVIEGRTDGDCPQ